MTVGPGPWAVTKTDPVSFAQPSPKADCAAFQPLGRPFTCQHRTRETVINRDRLSEERVRQSRKFHHINFTLRAESLMDFTLRAERLGRTTIHRRLPSELAKPKS